MIDGSASCPIACINSVHFKSDKDRRRVHPGDRLSLSDPPLRSPRSTGNPSWSSGWSAKTV